VGDKTIEAALDDSSAGTAEAFSYVASTTGSATHLSIYLDSHSVASRVILGLYSDSAGHPNMLLASGMITSPVAGAWNSASIASTPVSSGATYWIAVLGPSGSGLPQLRDKNGSASQQSSATNLAALPTTWSTGQSWPSGSMSAYASP
jgi:hypothetical protein